MCPKPKHPNKIAPSENSSFSGMWPGAIANNTPYTADVTTYSLDRRIQAEEYLDSSDEDEFIQIVTIAIGNRGSSLKMVSYLLVFLMRMFTYFPKEQVDNHCKQMGKSYDDLKDMNNYFFVKKRLKGKKR